MQIRRIVTGHGSHGKSVFVSDAPAPRTIEFKHVPGLAATLVWETPENNLVPTAANDDPSVSAASWVPPPGGTNLMFIKFPPDSVLQRTQFDAAAAAEEYMRELPGLANTFEVENPGMHTTDSVDYAILIDGELYLELDEGITKKLVPHDVVIQNGTRHAWRNKSDRPATMLFVFVGAMRRN